MRREDKRQMRYRAAGMTALATIALATGGIAIAAGTVSKPAESAGAEPFTASASGQLDLWSTLPAGQTAAAGGKKPQPQTEAVAPVRTVAAARPRLEPEEQPGGVAGFFARARALFSEYLSSDPAEKGETPKPFRMKLPPSETDTARRGGIDQMAALAFGDDSRAPGRQPGLHQTAAAGSGEVKASPGVKRVETGDETFGADPEYDKTYNPEGQVDIYGGKSEVDPPRPPIELGRPQYTEGEYEENSTIFGVKNPLVPGLAVYGDSRTAVAWNNNAGDDLSQIATRINIDIDFKITGTERLHAFFTPLQDGAEFTRYEFAGEGADKNINKEFDYEPQTLFFEGDAAAIYAGFSDEYQSMDIPFTVGLYPLFLQNGIWADDAIGGAAVSLPAQNSADLGISNFDVTFFGAINDVTNPGVLDDDGNLEGNDVNVYGVTGFFDAMDGYWEVGYGALHGYEDREGLLAHFLTAAYSRRYYNTISNSTRVFWNFTNIAGLDVGGDNNDQNVDGFAFISENSLISGLPSTLIPYANFFVGHNTPQPLVENEGILKNVGINFETDALTGFPKLDDTGSNTWGGALGLQYLFDLDQQLLFEVAMVQPFDDPVVGAEDPQYGFGVRYQLPITQAWLIRADATYQLLDGATDSHGLRFEVRRKF